MKKHLRFLLTDISIMLTVFTTLPAQHINPRCIISAENCTDLYAGIDNPISIMVQPYNSLTLDQVSCEGGTLTGKDGNFTVKPNAPGELTIFVKVGDKVAMKHFRVNPVLPVLRLGGRYLNGAFLHNGEFKVQYGISSGVECCGFDAKCVLDSYTVLRVSKDGKMLQCHNLGNKFEAETLALINMAMPGDQYIFFNILTRCPGDKGSRRLGAISFGIE